ncbi:peptidoglycan DD-metalloendopeptidase family protein [Candidatus Nitrosacidococcus tergens]|uniref:Peptidase M23 n=1 Tax=Candidatus Nitrosacidococcus tergens TaxID=553981 RepID=A0A7G1Q7Z4_9GAMM|nr:peptidoglycan DD-metalloendopeptidase family protein [Candidatus Nitrosacidococcus tergens]CAB1274877.1 Peptidase M23 [Candidatus Nitrosacidococcus tergens]
MAIGNFCFIWVIIFTLAIESCSFIKPPAYYTVKRGDTLSSIGRKYNIDYESLSQWNSINASNTIYTGQKLRLVPTAKELATHTGTSKKIKIASSKKKNISNQSPQPLQQSLTSIYWQWPTQGKIIKRFSSTIPIHKGIDIQGKLGQSVVAAADGEVVYSGVGPLQYGNLIILKHKDNFLSAYAHNQILTVKEGSFVRKGQEIAKLGSSGTTRVKLHFEIRYNDKAVDPLKYLTTR